MILPTKHITMNRCLLGVGAIVLEHLKRPQTVTRLWTSVRSHPDVVTFDRFILALDLLYLMGAVDTEGRLLQRVKL